MTGGHLALPVQLGILARVPQDILVHHHHAAADLGCEATVTIDLHQGDVAICGLLQGRITIHLLLLRSEATHLLQGSKITQGRYHLMIKGTVGTVLTLVVLWITCQGAGAPMKKRKKKGSDLVRRDDEVHLRCPLFSREAGSAFSD